MAGISLAAGRASDAYGAASPGDIDDIFCNHWKRDLRKLRADAEPLAFGEHSGAAPKVTPLRAVTSAIVTPPVGASLRGQAGT